MIPGREAPLEEGMAAHSSILAWRIPWIEGLVGYSPRGPKWSDKTEQLSMHAHTHTHTHPIPKGKKKMTPGLRQ